MKKKIPEYKDYAFGIWDKPLRGYCEELKNQRELGNLFITVCKDAFDNVKYEYANPCNISISGGRQSGKTYAKQKEGFYVINKIATAMGTDFAKHLLSMVLDLLESKYGKNYKPTKKELKEIEKLCKQK